MTKSQKLTKRLSQAAAASVVLGLVLAGLVLAAGLPNADKPVVAGGEGDDRPLPVQTTLAKPSKHFAVNRPFSGFITARRATKLSFERPGKIVEVSVDDGDQVNTGDVIARLDTRRLETRKRQLLAQRAAARAVLAELEQGPRQEQIDAARAETDNLKAQLGLESARHRRQRRLFHAGTISQEDYDHARFGLAAATERHRAANRRLDELLAGVRQEKIDAQIATVEHLNASLEEIEVEVEDSVLKAPFAGVIDKRRLDEGAVVAAGQVVAALVERHQLEARIGLPSRLAAHLKIGAKTKVLVDGATLDGKIVSCSPQVDETTRTQTVVIKIAEGDVLQAVPGQVARMKVAESVDQAGFWLPTTSLVRGPRGLWSCFVATGQHSRVDAHLVVERRDVEVLHTTANRVYVRGTIQSGDRVVASGAHRIVEGQEIQMVNN